MSDLVIKSVGIPIEIIGSYEKVKEICIKQDLLMTKEQYIIIHNLAINLKLGQKIEGTTGGFYPIVERVKSVDDKEEYKVSSFVVD